ncbi:LuxR C-terminal-related transcriptional regulator [Pseudonocardia broussonetiae]|uniref:HTH luxR-type domain-containing protein n=1 Tax=Pseudonocardia broussonetiae TaxID=2736640 RepID=A0A6M6JPM6_9PSEU|nr:LuxR C-terminal-related transcriptional regulator [Pseudonocardia broussonetiae]QJY49183.1 hypothetical protein HOP40_28350 [Pseudonocardia broussonetiae]
MRDVARSTLTPPALPRDLVTRPSLRAVLDSAATSALTLVTAPAGYGKSLLLADWIVRDPGVPAAWVSLDEEHDDPSRLWTAVLAALCACAAVPPSSRLRRLVASRTTVEMDFLDDLLLGLAALPQPLRLVLDDAHHLHSAPVVDHLRMVVRARLPQVQLVLAGRLDPPFPLARLRLEDELVELRAEHLRFSAAESADLLRRSGLRLTPEQCGLLHERTGGWVAGVRLAARSLSEHPDPDAFLAAFSGDERAVADYLMGEVLAGITEEHRDVLRRTSIVDPIPAALAVELCGRDDAAVLLHDLEHDLGLVTRTGPEGADYHVQELLRTHFVADLRRRGDDATAALHRKAALWWDRRGHPAEAVRHAGATGDAGLLAEMLGQRGAELVAAGEHGVLRAVLDTAGHEPAVEVWRCVLAAQVDLEKGDTPAVAEHLRHARLSGRPATGTDLAALLTAIERLAGLDASVPPVEPVPENPSLAALARAGRGSAGIATGAFASARADLTASLASARRLELPLLEAQCLYALAVGAWTEGDLVEAAAVATAACEEVSDRGWQSTGLAASARAVAALVAVEQGRPDAALAWADLGLRNVSARVHPAVRFALRVARGAALHDTGEKSSGLLELQQARAAVSGTDLPPVVAAAAAVLEQRIALRLGHTRAAAAAVLPLAGVAEARWENRLMRSWAEVAAGSFRAARATVAPVLDPRARPLRPTTVVEAWLVTAKAAIEDGDRPAAREALRSALDRARPLDAVRPFVLASAPVGALLVDELVGGGQRARFAAHALAGARRSTRPPGLALTAREHDVLLRLPSLLNLDEIADELSVSVNTVKSHVRSIYDKLGAATRRGAVLTAHELGLLR